MVNRIADPNRPLEEQLKEFVAKIEPLNEEALKEARERQDCRLKVPGSLGRLEDISVKLAGITGRPYGNDVTNQGIIIMSADNGVTAEGVASAPQTVTLMQTINFTKRITGVGSQAAYFGIDILDIDIGVALPIPEEDLSDDMLENGRIQRKVVNRRIADGTKDLAKEPAMTREQALDALFVGIEAAKAAKDAGKTLIGVGEMGIGNSTTGACVICALTGTTAAEVCGRGGGLDDKGMALKIKVVDDALANYASNGRAAKDPIGVAADLSGFDILGMAGAYIGAAVYKIPVVVDGFISIAAAILAEAIAPGTKNYMFTSHRSEEKGYAIAVKSLGIEPMFDLGMRLGEASGCPIAFKIIEASTAVINNMKSLAEGSIDDGYLRELKKNHYL
ncbi:MAG: nicotinate-nucleotide--dimethylbenzimidazole phosphoribosyltransferase [Eubacterium sp.]|jgi:nicotinate-nucleotide--dimethylbenzimidazole phosphoribosyltransferase